MKRYSLKCSVGEDLCGDFVRWNQHWDKVIELKDEIETLKKANEVLGKEYSGTAFMLLRNKCETLEEVNEELKTRITELEYWKRGIQKAAGRMLGS